MTSLSSLTSLPEHGVICDLSEWCFVSVLAACTHQIQPHHLCQLLSCGEPEDLLHRCRLFPGVSPLCGWRQGAAAVLLSFLRSFYKQVDTDVTGDPSLILAMSAPLSCWDDCLTSVKNRYVGTENLCSKFDALWIL